MTSPITKEIVLMIKESMYKAGVVADPHQWIFLYFIRMHKTIL